MKRSDRRGAGLLIVALAATSLGAATPLYGQFATIEPGQTVTGTLSELDPVPSTRGAFKVYQFRARAGERLTAVMRSAASSQTARTRAQSAAVTLAPRTMDTGRRRRARVPLREMTPS